MRRYLAVLLPALLVLSAAVAQAQPKTAAAAAAAAAGAAQKIDLNTASEKDLISLPGVGPATARKIIAGRPFSSVADLAKAGVNASTIQKIAAAGAFTSAPGAAKLPAAVSAKPAAATPAPAVPAAPAAPSPASVAAKPAAAAKAASASTAASVAGCSPGMVWVNLETKVYHKEGDKWFGKTKRGKCMNEADATKAGYTLSKEGGAKKKKQ